jgi:hypothetical protein
MQAELEKQENDEASHYTADKQVSDHLIGELHFENEHEIHYRRENGQKYILKHCCFLTH